MKPTLPLPKNHNSTWCVVRSGLAKIRTTHYALPLSLTLLIILLLTACGGQANAEPSPPVIHYGEDICEFCGMIISDERFAAGYLTADGQERIFDDLGGMFKAHLERQETVTAFFVHDFEATKWIRAEKAHYVLSQELPTPMLNGLVACESRDKAEALAAEYNAQVLDFHDVLDYYQENSAMMMGHEEMDHHP